MIECDVPVGIIFPVGFQIQGQGARGAPVQRLSILGRELHALQVSTQLCQISPPSTALQVPSQGLFQTYSERVQSPWYLCLTAPGTRLWFVVSILTLSRSSRKDGCSPQSPCLCEVTRWPWLRLLALSGNS